MLFHWTDAGEPAWRKQVPAGCIGQRQLSASCKASFKQADIAFVTALAAALVNAQGQGSGPAAGAK